MAKELKDYLHLYLGCRDSRILKVVKSNYFFVHELSIHKDDELVLLPHLVAAYENYGKGCEWKLILRPLSDMPVYEVQEVDKIVNQYNGDKVFEAMEGMAAATKYLLSKHFDLFGLIPDGLAIDKTKINQP